MLPAAYCVYDATPLPSPPSRSCLFIYRPRVHTWGPSISTPERVLGSWDSSCDISYPSTFHPRQFSFSLVLVSYTFPAPACVFSPIPWVLGLSISFHFILPPPSELPCFFPFWQQLHFFFSDNTKVYQYRLDPHILGLSCRIITLHFFSRMCYSHFTFS